MALLACSAVNPLSASFRVSTTVEEEPRTSIDWHQSTSLRSRPLRQHNGGSANGLQRLVFTQSMSDSPFIGDTLQPFMTHLDTYWLHFALQVSRAFFAAAKLVVISAEWQAKHFTLEDLLSCDGFLPLWRSKVAALHPESILLRLRWHPVEATMRLRTARWPRSPTTSRPPTRIRFFGETVALHLACHYQAGRTVVLALLQLDPSAIAQRTDSGLLPVHLASMSTRPITSTDTLEAIIEADPDAVRMFTGLLGRLTFRGWLPLHLAVSTRERTTIPSTDVIRVLLKAHPGAIAVPNEHGMLPLHVAVDECAPAATIALLLQAFPEACLKPATSGGGWLPLHMAVEANYGKTPCLETVKLLLRHGRDAANVLDERGMDAIRLATETGACPRVIQLLEGAMEAFGLG